MEVFINLKVYINIEVAKMTNKVNAGDVFYTSWGYDQTNYDYVVVDKVSPSGKTAVCRRAVFKTIGQNGHCNVQVPTGTGYGQSFRMKVVDRYDGSVGLRGSYIFCGDDSKRFDSFSKHTAGSSYNETDSMFGH